jgi:hypothetical protein
MSEAINCPSCGASNHLPEGKNSMFCAFCGNAIQKILKANTASNESSIKTKPQISQRKTEKTEVPHFTKSGNLKYKKEETVVDYGGALSLINRELRSLDEITSWFSDNELSEIKGLFLNDNKIANLNGIERFTKLQMLNLSNNQITNLDDFAGIKKELSVEIGISLKNNKLRSTKFLSKLRTPEIDLSENELVVLEEIPQFSFREYLPDNIDFNKIDISVDIKRIPKYEISINLSNNKKLQKFSENVINTLNNYENNIMKLEINLSGCLEFDQSCLNSINTSIFNNVCFLILDKKLELSNELRAKGFEHFFNEHTSKVGTTYRYYKTQETGKKSNSGCFIATAAMGSYNHPLVVELRHFRDNWILEKKWGEAFVAWYYHYGAIAAKSIEKSFVLRKLSYIFIVNPLVYLSRFLKK